MSDIVEELMFADDLNRRAAEEINFLRREVLRLHSQILGRELDAIHAREQANRERLYG